MNFRIPTFGDVRRCGVESIISFIVEGNSLKCIFCLFDIGAGSNSIILEESRATSFPLWI